MTVIPFSPRTGAGEAGPDDRTLQILARTLYGEARGEGRRGLEAVAAVILNRVARAAARGGYWWGTTVAEVCQKPWQFSCWNRGDPNRRRIERVTDADPAFRLCLEVARAALAGALADPTGGACHYHAAAIRPGWARGRTPSARIGRHLFYAGLG